MGNKQGDVQLVATEDAFEQVYRRKGRRAKEEIKNGVAEFYYFEENEDEYAMRLTVSGSQGLMSYDC